MTILEDSSRVKGASASALEGCSGAMLMKRLGVEDALGVEDDAPGGVERSGADAAGAVVPPLAGSSSAGKAFFSTSRTRARTRSRVDSSSVIAGIYTREKRFTQRRKEEQKLAKKRFDYLRPLFSAVRLRREMAPRIICR
jgi:hypothetical protein